MKVSGAELAAIALQREGTDTFFFLMGAPMSSVEKACIDRGLRGIDVRHEQAAAMMAHAYARVSNRVGVCMACSGPGALNLSMGLANALVDCSPVVAFGGASPLSESGNSPFQEFDQVAAMAPLVKHAERIYETRRIPEIIAKAFRIAFSGKPGPVYLDFAGDILLNEIDFEDAVMGEGETPFRSARSGIDENALTTAVDWLSKSEKPVVITGSGVFWSDGVEPVRRLVKTTGIPLYSTPQGRGVVPEDDGNIFPNARSTAFREADVVLVIGTRLNYVFGHLRPPRFNKHAKIIRIDIDPEEHAIAPQVGLPILADAGLAIEQILGRMPEGVASRFEAWRERLRTVNDEKSAALEARMNDGSTPIHPLRLCKEVRDFLPRDAILAVDGQEILNFGRQSIPTFTPRHRLNSGPFGTMGVGLPFGIGAKAASPDSLVVVLHGDGSFAMNGMELDTARRHNLPVLTIISLNGGWTADPEKQKPGRDLGYTRFHELAEALDCAGFFVETPDAIRPTLEKALQEISAGRSAVVNVVTDWRARAQTVQFTRTST